MSLINNYLFIILALVAGMAMPTQASINSKLAAHVQSPVAAAFISFTVGAAALFAYMILTGVPLGNLALLKDAPKVTWIGGLLGAFFVTVMALTVSQKMDVALVFSLAIGGQMLMSILIAHFGWLGVEQSPVNPWRVLGAALITAGVVLIRKF